MSKLARKPLTIPPKVTVKLESNVLKIQGPKGTLEKAVPQGIEVTISSDSLKVTRKNDEKTVRMLHGMYTSLIINMMQGVTDGFKKELELVGVGYKADIKDKSLVLNVGFTLPVTMLLPSDISAKVEDKQTKLILTGIDKDKIGLYAAKIRAIKPPDAYKGKGIKFAGEVLKLKPGKSAAGATGGAAAGGGK
jgi:large subunit ribosomal protein L6